MIDRRKNTEFTICTREGVRFSPGTEHTAIFIKQFPGHRCERAVTPERYNIKGCVPARPASLGVVRIHNVLKVPANLRMLAKALDAPIRIPCEVWCKVALRDAVTVKGVKGSHKGIKECHGLIREF